MVNAQKESLLCFGREQDLKGEKGKSTYWCMPIVLSLFFLLFSLLSFLFLLFSFYFSYYSVLPCFSIPVSGHGKGPFIVSAVTRFYHFAP